METKNTFNEIAEAYDKSRPDYPEQLFSDIIELAAIGEGDSILEIGCGTGQATKGFVDAGFDRITCIELGDNLAAFTRNKFKGNPNVNVVNAPFETWQGEPCVYKLAISGTAFHFIVPQEAGYRKVFDLLDDEGSIALFWTVHLASYDEVSNRIRESYRKYAPHLDDSTSPTVDQVIEERSTAILKNNLFKELKVKQYVCNHTYTADEYIALLNTNSRHRLLSEDARLKLFKEIKDELESLDGVYVKPQGVILFLAKRNPEGTEARE